MIEPKGEPKYRVEPRGAACDACQRGEQYAIVSGEGDGATELSQTWGDLEEAEFICEELNLARKNGFAEGCEYSMKVLSDALKDEDVAEAVPSTPASEGGSSSEDDIPF